MSIKDHCIIRYEKYDFDYIGIPKTGSSSFKTSMWIQQGVIRDNDINWSMNWYKKYKDNLNYISKTENNKLTIIHFRNPVDRVISMFKDLTQGEKQYIKVKSVTSKNIESRGFEYFIDLLNDMSDIDKEVHLRSQSWFVNHIKNFNNHIIFQTEGFSNGLEKINKKLKLNLKQNMVNHTKGIENPRLNTSIKNKIERYYEKDFELWMKARKN